MTELRQKEIRHTQKALLIVMYCIFPSRSNGLVERTLACLTLKAVHLTLKVNRNPKLYYLGLGAFDPTVRPVT